MKTEGHIETQEESVKASTFQKRALIMLQKALPGLDATMEFSIGKGASDKFAENKDYLPRLDIAVGPYNITSDREENCHKIREAYENYPIIQKLRDIAGQQNGGCRYNRNPRCLLAVEIEFTGSSKQILGDFTNASMMGFVGLVIGPDTDYMNRIKGVANYVRTLRMLEKAPEELFMNVAWLCEAEFVDLLTRA